MEQEIMEHPLIQEIQNIDAAYRSGQINIDERNYLLQEIRDVRAAQECADDEATFRNIIQTVNIVASVV